MPESVSGVDDLVAGLRKTSKTFTRPMTGETYEVVTLADAEAAVHAAADARTQEIVAMLREEAADRMVSDPRGCLIIRDLTDRWIAREGVPR